MIVGKTVRKIRGYSWPGVVVCEFQTLKGETRLVVECTVPEVAGALHIYSPEQIELAPPAPGDRTKVDAISSAVEAEVEKIAQPIMALSDECVNALTHKRQIDHDGTEVGVSHQAVDEIHAALMAFRAAIRSRSHGGGNG